MIEPQTTERSVKPRKVIVAEAILKNYSNRNITCFTEVKPEILAAQIEAAFKPGMTWWNFGITAGKWNVNYRAKSVLPEWRG